MEEELLSMLHASLIRKELSRSENEKSRNKEATKHQKVQLPISPSNTGPLALLLLRETPPYAALPNSTIGPAPLTSKSGGDRPIMFKAPGFFSSSRAFEGCVGELKWTQDMKPLNAKEELLATFTHVRAASNWGWFQMGVAGSGGGPALG